jgi:hypothetical protein
MDDELRATNTMRDGDDVWICPYESSVFGPCKTTMPNSVDRCSKCALSKTKFYSADARNIVKYTPPPLPTEEQWLNSYRTNPDNWWGLIAYVEKKGMDSGILALLIDASTNREYKHYCRPSLGVGRNFADFCFVFEIFYTPEWSGGKQGSELQNLLEEYMRQTIKKYVQLSSTDSNLLYDTLIMLKNRQYRKQP